MASKDAGKGPEATGAEQPESAPKKSPMKLVAVALAVVVLEAGTVGVTMMMSGGPKRAHADELPVAATQAAVERDAEVPIVDAKLPNEQKGRLFLYDIQVVAKVNEKKKGKVEELLKERAAEVKDRIRTIIASSDPKSLSEPGLETLRRQIGYQLEQDLGRELIKELLIPKCTPYRAEF